MVIKINNKLLKSEILRRKKDFEQILASSKIISSPSFILRYLPNSTRKIGIIVSHRVAPKAVIRNRIKRYLREIYRTNKASFKDNYAYLFQARTAAVNKGFPELKDEVLALVKKINNDTN